MEKFGETKTVDLKENGRNIPVTDENKMEYVQLVCQQKLTGSIREQVRPGRFESNDMIYILLLFLAPSISGGLLRYCPEETGFNIR